MSHLLKYISLILCLSSSLISAQEVDVNEQIQNLMKARDSIAQSAVGKEFAAFKAITLDGDTISEKDLRGKVTMIDFWFQSCSPCIAEFEALSALYHKLKDNPGFQFISFTFDSKEDAEKIKTQHNLPYIIGLLTREECDRLNLRQGFPTHIITDTSGKIIFFKPGGFLEKEKTYIQAAEFEKVITEQLSL